VRITEKHYAPWVKARQEQLEADVRRTWPEENLQQEVHGGDTEDPAQIIPFKEWWRRGESKTVRVLCPLYLHDLDAAGAAEKTPTEPHGYKMATI
jgi:hypothetical protein